MTAALNQPIRKFLFIAAMGMTAIAWSGVASSAGYIKLDGVDGESKRQQQDDNKPKPRPAPNRVNQPDNTKPTGLLLPAVQRVHAPADKGKGTPKDGHSSGDEHEIEYDVTAGK